MAAEEFEDISKRYKTMPLHLIDEEYFKSEVLDKWNSANDSREDFLDRREHNLLNWRDLEGEAREGPWENSSNFHVPLTFIYGKSIHARLWQLFSDEANFFGVKARKEAFEKRELGVKNFMQFVLSNWCNFKTGTRDVFDEWLWQIVFDGSEYLKLYWDRQVHQYSEVIPVLNVEETTIIDRESLTGRIESTVLQKEKEEIKEEIIETPQIRRISLEDIVLPVGESDPQMSPWVGHRLFMTDDQLKSRARDEKFDKDQVELAIQHRVNYFSGGKKIDEYKRLKNEIDGTESSIGYPSDKRHIVIEWYGKLYVQKEVKKDDVDNDIDKFPQEVVVWIHEASNRILGWTYLYRISPSGIRPIFKGDFIRFPDRQSAVGVAEFLGPINRAVDAVYNLRMDAGTLSTLQWGVYRSSSGLKPDKIRLQPGTFYPVDDPQNDIRIMQTPPVGNFGYQEEANLTSYAEKGLNIGELQLGGTPSKVGLFRTASGANAVQQEAGIQLEIHFDRLARTLSRLLQSLFVLCRERMPENLYYRITGENGEPIFGKVNREDLKGEYDFEITVDVLGQSRIEQQQQATLLMQTLINPAFTNTGVVGPDQLYHLARNYLLKQRVRRIDNFIAEPQGYSGEVVTPSERLYRILVGVYKDPPITETVRLADDHEKAIGAYESFKQSDQYGYFNPDQIAALEELIARHVQLLQAAQAGGNPNLTGMQIPREGFNPQNTDTLSAPTGEVNGPVV